MRYFQFGQPHANGGDALITVSEEQALRWAQQAAAVTGFTYDSDETAIKDWVAIHRGWEVTAGTPTEGPLVAQFDKLRERFGALEAQKLVCDQRIAQLEETITTRDKQIMELKHSR